MTSPHIEILDAPGIQGISDCLSTVGDTAIHITNGTYAYKAEMIVPTMLAGFQYISEKIAGPDDIFLIAVNSNASMQGIMDKKNASQAERDALENELTRALKVAGPLAEQHPNRTVMVAFYDEETPTPLYNLLAEEGRNLKTLHKWGYGTDPKTPRIEGAHNFGMVLGFPVVNDVRPVCDSITAMEDQSRIVKVVKLHEETGVHGKPYISLANKVLFPVPASLASHAPSPVVTPLPSPKP
jgi:hypothetical protein